MSPVKRSRERAFAFPVSVKGVLLQDGKVVLLKNERDEWELPGGKLEFGESPEDCVAREIEEELGFRAEVGPILDTWVYELERTSILIVTYGCFAGPQCALRHSAEHRAVGLFDASEVEQANMPRGYKASVRAWLAYLAHGQTDPYS